MKSLSVPSIPGINAETSIEEVSALLDQLVRNEIAEVPWPSYDYRPEAAFALACNKEFFFLKYYIKEDSLRAVYRNTNDPVYKDSCVEFFISFNGEREYYNLEFNCMGTCMLGFGAGRNDRKLLPAKTILSIQSDVFIKSPEDESGDIYWELTLVIPISVFIYHPHLSLKEQTCKANFYKCGDDLPKPHFLTWSTIEAEQPDFHLPQFFGLLHLE